MSLETAFTVGIVTVSDTAHGDSTLDKSGPLLQDILANAKTAASHPYYKINKTTIIPDNANEITTIVHDWVDTHQLDLILFTGGTGFAARDVTPDSIEPLLTRLTPGITHLLISSSLLKTPFAALSRPVSGFRKQSLIITLPGSPKACRENMDALLPILPHALQLVRGHIDQVRNTHAQLASSLDSNNNSNNSTILHQHQHTCVHHHRHHQHHSPRTLNLDTPVAQRSRVSPYPMIPVEEAQRLIHDHALPVGTITMPLSEDLIGYVLAEDIYAKESVPGYRASIVDGYAVYAEDGPGVYPVSHVSLATSHRDQQQQGSSGTHTPFKLQRGHIARVATGGMVPDGANAVVMVEDTQLIEMNQETQEEVKVEILQQSTQPMIRSIGSDCQQGDLVCKKGTLLSTIGGELGVLASVGIHSVLVYRKPIIGILSSGNEVQDISQTRPLAPGEIRDSNRLTLKAAIKQAGFEVVDLGIVPDRVDVLEQCIQKALVHVDVLITTGGVSMGEADYMKPLLEQKIKATIHFGRVNMKPGKPCTFATAPAVAVSSTGGSDQSKPSDNNNNNKLIFALPGNPVSATVTFYLFVLPALRQMSFIQRPENVKVQVKITHDIVLDDRPEYHRVLVFVNSASGQLEATSTGKNQQSSRMISMIAANGLLQLPVKSVGISVMKKGDDVPCIILGSLYQA